MDHFFHKSDIWKQELKMAVETGVVFQPTGIGKYPWTKAGRYRLALGKVDGGVEGDRKAARSSRAVLLKTRKNCRLYRCVLVIAPYKSPFSPCDTDR